MTKTLPLWAALLFGVICGAVIGTIVAAFYLTLALKTGFQSFDMLALWKASAGTRAAHPEAFKVGFGAVGFGAIGLGVLALAWTWKIHSGKVSTAVIAASTGTGPCGTSTTPRNAFTGLSGTSRVQVETWSRASASRLGCQD